MEIEPADTGAATLAPELGRLPAIAHVVRTLELAENRPFRGSRVLAVQHLHSSILPLVDAVRVGGVRGDRVTVVGKSYSTRPAVLAELRARGARAVDPLCMRDPRHSYEDELARHVEDALDDVHRHGGAGPLLVLDEGAVAARVLARRPELGRRCALVEQTTRGARWLDGADLPFPAVDVARSIAKAAHEGPLVARTMMQGLAIALGELRRDLPRPVTRAGVIGYGRMGSRLARLLLAEGLDVRVHDVAEAGRRQAAADGFRVDGLDEVLDTVDLLVGCTGGNVLGEAELARAGRSLVLVNCASSDIEYALWPRRRAAAALPCSAGRPDQPWRNHYEVDVGRRHILLAGGFPINFYCPGEPISAREFQITRGLMLAGLAQAAGLSAPGLTPLDSDLQRSVSAAYTTAMTPSPGPAT